jgi:hypothetical protein
VSWHRVLSKKPVQPRFVKGGVHPQAFLEYGVPELLRFGGRPLSGQAVCLKQHLNECLQPFGARVADAGLPVLERAPPDTQACGQVALGQSRPRTVT